MKRTHLWLRGFGAYTPGVNDLSFLFPYLFLEHRE